MQRSGTEVISVEPEVRAKRGVRAETEAVVAGTVGAAVSGAVALLLFLGALTPLWAVGRSVGVVAGIAVFAASAGAAGTAYMRSRRQPGQEWRRRIRPWQDAVDIGTVAAVHAAIAAVLTVAVFVLLQRSFEGLEVDAFIGTLAVVASAGFSGYLAYSSAAAMTTRKMSTLLVTYMAVATLGSIAAVEDPLWWEYHFSQLGTADDFSAFLFNSTLIVAGVFVTTFSLYLTRDLTTLAERGVLERAWAPRFYGIVFVVLGLMLAGVGLFPLDVSIALHNGCAAGMAASFAAMVLGSPAILRGLPRRFFVFCYAAFALLIGGFLLYAPIGYWNLTAFELVAFSLIFGWITVFIRFVNAITVDEADAPSPPGADAAPRPASRGVRP
ncbi:hypothetical protein FLP10_09665 [Agromyces intestinalis]|uniref:DUF998 domain-containing protein n=1 Tax=Agromyces intestinalis TaxID=2592652 RepID=A0A5C1YEV7_9MICO|nr:DUF998 domain-containing protein [Agromyces intestinalis]QEO14651.1 hypothetical protein FLP10_09665 [Agromyces intestinalis]